MPNTAIVVIGGDAPAAAVVARLPAARTVYAADSGLDHAERLGLAVDRLVGDLDSVSDEALARHADRPIDRHPVDKDATDTELALDAAIADGHDHVVVVSGGGDRLDHLLGTLTVLARRARDVRVEAWIGTALVHVLHGGQRLVVAPPVETLVSLVPLDGPAIGVHAHGLRWTLAGDTLVWGSSRGVSNVAVGEVDVTLDDGVLAIILPHALEPGDRS